MSTNETVVLEVKHRTGYDHAEALSTSQHLLHLKPHDSPWQRTLEHRIDVEPAPDESIDGADWFGNATRIVAINQSHARFAVNAVSRLELLPRAPLAALDRSLPWQQVAAALASNRIEAAPLEARQYLFDSPHVLRSTLLADYARENGIARKDGGR